MHREPQAFQELKKTCAKVKLKQLWDSPTTTASVVTTNPSGLVATTEAAVEEAEDIKRVFGVKVK